jgi:hypothetical protein
MSNTRNGLLTEERSGEDLHLITAKPNTWTFQNDAVRKFVQERLSGRVLNLFAGKTKLHHDDEIIRVDLDEERDADHYFDAIEVRDRFGGQSFDTVVLDPPFSVQQSRKRYNGRYRGHFTHVKDEVAKVVRPGGRTLTFGYHSRAMGPSRGFNREELAVFDHGGRFRAMLGVVEQRVERDLGDFEEAP